ncbi:MFS transporter [Candidatus Sodalis endolongispinus]|uniref:MFS transporter n=1 Tax=Candidatus Sodalis endolongispinus TaxID=2812662 RepID=A0ABS5YAF2_9GAMM|nr:MFS transporter [Candidatus Sodalis endolongispinus]
MPYFSFLPMLADTVLHGGPTGSGILMSITGVGALLAALQLTFAGQIGAMGPWPLRAAVMLALAQVLLGLSQHFWLSAIIAAPIGFAILTQNLTSNSLLQHRVPASPSQL